MTTAIPTSTAERSPRCVVIVSRQLARSANLARLLALPVRLVSMREVKRPQCQPVVVAAWGLRARSQELRRLAQDTGADFVALEDGFLRSYGPGDGFPFLSLIVDPLGLYYDARHPSELERLLQSDQDYSLDHCPAARLARALLVSHALSKYNQGRPWRQPPTAPPPGGGTARILVVDQTLGDASVALGQASEQTFAAMLDAARMENPGATIYIKTHPEVSAGRKSGYLTRVMSDERTFVVREAVNPFSLLAQMDRVYVVTSTLGFEALLAGKPVTCFGLPWYAGWGVTDDRQSCTRRTRRRTVDELFAAAYLHYTRYLDPETHQRGTIFQVMDWLVRQRRTVDQWHGERRDARLIFVGFRRWKAANLRPLFSLEPGQVAFAGGADQAARLTPRPGDCLVHWGAEPPTGLKALAQSVGAQLVSMEDGFLRSVGLGSDLVPPRSVVLDRSGIYFDATRASDLETLLNTTTFGPQELAEAKRVREFIVAHGLTKYNLETHAPVQWPGTAGRPVLLVPGQVEDDASIRLGCTSLRTNLALLQAVRAAHPGAFIVYKPHPDVASGNRRGHLAPDLARRYADHVETRAGVVSCIDACNEVHTLTSLAGFDALLRGKKVVTYGQPFYAGWGLTQDHCPAATALARRQRRLSLDELVAGTLLRYPLYWDPVLRGYTTCMAVLRQLVAQRDALAREGRLESLRTGRMRRLWRKLLILTRSCLAPRTQGSTYDQQAND